MKMFQYTSVVKMFGITSNMQDQFGVTGRQRDESELRLIYCMTTYNMLMQ